MSADPAINYGSGSTGEITQALYFASGEHQLFGWLHRPAAGQATDLGLVLCNPFGYESICSHRSVRAFAEAAAAVGVCSLRFDYRGTGDSADIEPGADQIPAWSEDVAAAVSELQRQTGIRRICLLGFRIGALLAALAARDCGEVSGVMLVAPIISGRRYVREMRTTRLAAMMGSGSPQAPTTSADAKSAAGSAPLEVSGFLLASATLTSLSKIDLCTLDEAPAPNVFLIDGEALPAARGWSETLLKAGVKTTYRAMPGIVEMLMTAPQFAVVPRPMITALQEWLSSFAPVLSTAVNQMTARYVAEQSKSAKSVMNCPAVHGFQTAILTERAVRFGPDAALFGIVTEPARDERRRRAVILLSPGVDHHIGASRLYVSFARQWSGRGYVVLRMDLAGIGDSATRPGLPEDDVFPADALDDIRSAIALLSNTYHVGDISLVGLCSGAYHALRAAAAGIKVQRIIMINPQNYFWKKGMSLNDLQTVEVLHNPGVYRQRVLSVAAWKRLFIGEVNLFRIAAVYVQRLNLAIFYSVRNLARSLHVRLPDDLGRELQEIAARGVSIVFVFARDEPGIDLLKLEGGTAVARLGNQCRIHILDKGDHVFSHHDSRAALEEVLCVELLKGVR